MKGSKPANPLSVYEFGRELLRTNDLDPVYVLLHNSDVTGALLRHWLIAYWGFYHVGTASWITDGVSGDGYWNRMEQAAGSKEYPRSSERRHFRGGQALASVAFLKERGVQTLFKDIMKCQPGDASSVMESVKTWRGFGPWIAFKVADMLERLEILSVEFDDATTMYDSPQKAAEHLYSLERPNDPPPQSVPEKAGVGSWALIRVKQELRDLKAPPSFDRPVGNQEAETVLCKWKSYLGGHYHVGEDVEACRKALTSNQFKDCNIARRLYAGGVKGGLWDA